jgi:hypothetical protein
MYLQREGPPPISVDTGRSIGMPSSLLDGLATAVTELHSPTYPGKLKTRFMSAKKAEDRKYN